MTLPAPLSLGFLLVTVSKVFSPELFAKAAANPSRLPAFVLPAPAKVVHTFGVAVYNEEVTCLVRTHRRLALHRGR